MAHLLSLLWIGTYSAFSRIFLGAGVVMAQESSCVERGRCKNPPAPFLAIRIRLDLGFR